MPNAGKYTAGSKRTRENIPPVPSAGKQTTGAKRDKFDTGSFEAQCDWIGFIFQLAENALSPYWKNVCNVNSLSGVTTKKIEFQI